MADRNKCTLQELTISINTGLDAIRRAPIVEKKTDIRCLRIQDISQCKSFEKWGYTEVIKKDFEKFQLITDDIIMARTCSTGICYLVKENIPAVFNNGLARIRLDKEKAYPQFMYYVFKSKHFTDYIDGISRGTSVQLNMKIGDLEKYEFHLPSLENQKKIAYILGKYDDKIQLNTQTNQTLEAIAQAIFKSWFVDFDPVRAKAAALSEGKSEHEANLAAMSVICGKDTNELNDTEYKALWQIAEAFPSELVESEEFGEVPKGWKYTTLSEICTMQNGYAFKSSDWRDNGIPVIKIGSIQSNIVNVFGNGFVDLEYTETKKDFVLKSGDIIIALTGAYVGKAGIMPANSLAMLNQRVAKFLPKTISNNVSYYSYIYCLSQRTELKDFISFTAQGSAQPNISTKELLAFKILLGNKELHLHFEKVCKILLDKMISNSGENENLSSIRDLLLPKLLSGELLNE
ncbi:restriction endonuclease subunit S [Mannheimia sp. E30BD]|uniref:restriction endonuclease subunit S n=1 Tax=Mannheimia sp. E30BD TaxID=3278708 RepID=UPI00359D0A89